MEAIELQADGWRCRGWLAETYWERWRGVRLRPPPVLIPGSSVHAFRLTEPLTAIGIAADGSVVGQRPLQPGRLVWLRGARWILELPVDHPLPTLGSPIAGGPLSQP